MNIQDVYYHGIRSQIRRVLMAMTPEQLDKGMTAFDNGGSNWSHCFFARALSGQCNLAAGSPERQIMQTLGINTPVPIRIVYHTFDGMGKTMTRGQMADFMRQCKQDMSREVVKHLDFKAQQQAYKDQQQVIELLKGLDFAGVEELEVAGDPTCR